MTSKTFVVDDYTDLLALQRVFREAKFCTEPDDADVSDSPIVASMFERLIATLMAYEIERDGTEAEKRWIHWLMIDESRDEWDAALRRARTDQRWMVFTAEERAKYVAILLSPFRAPPNVVERFVLAVNTPDRV